MMVVVPELPSSRTQRPIMESPRRAMGASTRPGPKGLDMPRFALVFVERRKADGIAFVETAREALRREIVEELECHVTTGDQVETTTYEYDFGIVTLTTFYCELVDAATPTLTEHAEVRWLTPDALLDLDWAPADIPAVERIQADFARNVG